ncbi:MAG: phospholipid carrier-dependent glycosyltransferase, partial [Gammaproteobacteria bacterium]
GYLWASLEPAGGFRRIMLGVAGLGCGLAFLTKGFLAVVVPVIVVIPYLVWQRRWKDLLVGLWLPLAVAALVALPWSVLIQQQEPDFWRYFFWEEHVRRFAAEDAQHVRPFWLFLAVFPAMALPWTFLVPAAYRGLRLAEVDRSTIAYLLLWLLLPLLLFSIARGKLLTYVLPCFPALATLLAIGLAKGLDDSRLLAVRAGLRLQTGMWLVLILALVLNRFAGIGRPFFDAAEGRRWAALVTALAAGVVTLAYALRSPSTRRQILATGIAMAPLLLAVPFVIPNATRQSKMPGNTLAALSADLPRDVIVISDGVYVHAVAWVLKRADIYLLSPGEMLYGSSYPEDKPRLLTVDGLRRLLEDVNRQQVLFIACDRDRRSMVQAALDDAALTLSATPGPGGGLVTWTIPPNATRQSSR